MSNNTTQHTPTPWIYDRVTSQIWDDEKRAIVDMDYGDLLPDTDVANAAFIVKAVNSHEHLLEGLKTALENGDCGDWQSARRSIVAALAAAGEQP